MLKMKRALFLGARFENEDVALVKKASKLRGEDISDFLRRSVRRELARLSMLSEDEMKALEMPENEVQPDVGRGV